MLIGKQVSIVHGSRNIDAVPMGLLVTELVRHIHAYRTAVLYIGDHGGLYFLT